MFGCFNFGLHEIIGCGNIKNLGCLEMGIAGVMFLFLLFFWGGGGGGCLIRVTENKTFGQGFNCCGFLVILDIGGECGQNAATIVVTECPKR